jgi:uroporphyrinogen-III synthase
MHEGDLHILSTRAIEAGLIRKAAQHGITAEVKDLIATRTLSSAATIAAIREALNEGGYMVFTSVHAVQAVKEHAGRQPDTGSWNVFCLEGKTFSAVQQWFPEQPLIDKAAAASALADRILSHDGIRSVTFFCGDQRRPELPEKLQAHGIIVKEITVYETIQTPVAVKETYDGVLFFSPSAVKSFFSRNRLAAGTVCFTIGHTTAQAVKDHTGNPVIVSPRQSAEALMDTVIFYFEHANRYE